jgi:hypothetical protein
MSDDDDSSVRLDKIKKQAYYTQSAIIKVKNGRECERKKKRERETKKKNSYKSKIFENEKEN